VNVLSPRVGIAGSDGTLNDWVRSEVLASIWPVVRIDLLNLPHE
jgi:hypothetical protein